jgi:regulator of protease activity HflC (stomatin/prohibitin superfamily)
MIGLIISIIVFIVAIAAGFFMYTESESEKAGFVTFGIVTLIAVAILVFSCMKSVPTGHTGVVSSFGKVEDTTLDSGIHFMKPWKNVIKMDNRVQKNTIKLACFSSDIQEVNIDYTVNYQIDKKNAMNIYKSIGKDYYNTVIAPTVTEAVKEVTALYTAENLVNRREEMSNKVETLLSERLIKYNIEVVMQEKIKLYLEYVEKTSFWYDIKLIFKTFWVIITE